MTSTLRVLIIEDNAVIAADIHRIVESAYPATAAYARSFAEAVTITDSLAAFDLAIVNPPLHIDASNAALLRVAQACSAMVVCSAAPISLTGTPLEDAEFILKPFADEDLLKTCRRALSGTS